MFVLFIYFLSCLLTLAPITGTNKNSEVTISSVISTEDTLVNGNSGEDMWVSPSHNYFLNWKASAFFKKRFLHPASTSVFFILSFESHKTICFCMIN